MKVLSYDPERCVGCFVCEETCSFTWFKVGDQEKSNIRITVIDTHPHSANFCIQCGDCIDACPTNAIFRDRRGIVRIRKNLCVGCMSCVGFCPYAAMRHHEDQIEPFKCVACGQCTKECPGAALTIIDGEDPPPTETEKWLGE
jgi:Fe-S-cluster-containing dehydrogenase component